MALLLSDDIHMNIFSRLPVKSLAMVKCVCKEWRSIVDDTYFKSLHRERSFLKPNFLGQSQEVYHEYTSSSISSTRVNLSSVDFDGNHNFNHTLTFDGELYCYLHSKGELLCFICSCGFYVWNPSTKELVKLSVFASSLLDKKNLVKGTGFAYVEERDEYVLIKSYNDDVDFDDIFSCEIMTWTDGRYLKKPCWKVVKYGARCPYNYICFEGVLVENIFYWLGYHDDGKIVSPTFDLEKEEFGVAMLPILIFRSQNYAYSYLTKLNGSMFFFLYSDSTVYIWLLKDPKNHAWVKEYNINVSMFPFFYVPLVPIYYIPGKILVDIKCKGTLEWYDVENKCFEEFYDFGSPEGLWREYYIDSLFSLAHL